MLNIKIFFYIQLNKNIENNEKINIELDSITCINLYNKNFILNGDVVNYNIIFKDAVNSVLEIEVIVKIDIISKKIIDDLKIEYIDMKVFYSNNRLIDWKYKFIENKYWYKITKK